MQCSAAALKSPLALQSIAHRQCSTGRVELKSPKIFEKMPYLAKMEFAKKELEEIATVNYHQNTTDILMSHDRLLKA